MKSFISITFTLFSLMHIIHCDNYEHNQIVNTNPSNYINVEFDYSFGGAGRDWGTSVMIAKDNTYVLCGITDSFGYGETNTYVIKVSFDGTLEWQAFYGGWGEDTGESVLESSDSSIYIAGTTSSFNSKTGKKVDPAVDPYYLFDEYNFYLVKVTQNGDIHWEKIYGDTLHNEYCTDAAVADDGIVLTGYVEYDIDGNKDIYIVKTDFDGTLLWQKTIGRTAIEQSLSVIATSDGGSLVAGYTSPGINQNSDMYLIKMDQNGNISWENRYGTIDFDEQVTSILESTDGYIAAGNLRLATDPALANGILTLLKVDFNGNLTWSYSYPQSHSSRNNKILKKADESLINCGYDVETEHIVMTKLDNDGQYIWSEADSKGYILNMCLGQAGVGTSYLLCGANMYPENSSGNNLKFIKLTEDLTNIE